MIGIHPIQHTVFLGQALLLAIINPYLLESVSYFPTAPQGAFIGIDHLPHHFQFTKVMSASCGWG